MEIIITQNEKTKSKCTIARNKQLCTSEFWGKVGENGTSKNRKTNKTRFLLSILSLWEMKDNANFLWRQRGCQEVYDVDEMCEKGTKCSGNWDFKW